MMKRAFSIVLLIALAIGLFGGEAFALGEKNFPTGSTVRLVDMTLSTIDLYDYNANSSGGAYIFRPSIEGRFSYLIQSDGAFEAYLFRLNDKAVITGAPKKYSGSGSLTINATLKQSVRYMLVVGKQITLASNGRVQSVTSPGGKIQMQVMYDYRGHAFARPYTAALDKEIKERIRTPYQSEFYKFTAPYDAVYDMKVGGGGIVLRILDAKGRLTSNEKSLAANKGDVYYLRINRKEKKTGAYTLKITVGTPKQEIPISKVTLSAKKKTISDGKSTTLKAKFAPTYATETQIKWSSSNEKIALVNDQGVVKAVGPGKVKITATAKSGQSASCTVTVKAVKVKSISVKKKLSLKVGTFEALTVKFNPSNASVKDIKWVSSKKSVATVDAGGNVLAIKPGKTVIKATSKDGKRTAQCTVTVVAN